MTSIKLSVVKFKMAAVAMVTKVQKMLNSLQASQSFAVMYKVKFSTDQFEKYITGTVSRASYVCSMGYKFTARTDL
jgi:hypothetical protein